MTDYEMYYLIVVIVGNLIISISLVITIIQIRLLVKNHKDNHDWNRRIETQKAIDRIRAVDAHKLNEVFGFKYRREPIPLDEIISKFESDWDLERQCILLLNTYEALAAGAKLGIYDEDVIAMVRKGAMQRTFTRFKLYIEHIRCHTKNTTYQEYQKLIKKWDDKENYTEPKAPIAK